MRKFRLVLGLMALSVLLLGMGGQGGSPAGSIPQTDEDIQARVTDRAGVMTEVGRFSMDGNLFFEGTRGNAKLTVSFHNLTAVDFTEVQGEDVATTLRMKSGSSLPLNLRKRAIFYGNTGFGSYQIRAYDVMRIEFP